MRALYKTEVTPDQIDHLGHMNVRYYGVHARAGATELLGSIGLEPGEDTTILQRDSYVRHYREQLVGVPLEVRGAVLSASADRIQIYEELFNEETDELAATFVLSFELADRSTRGHLALPGDVVRAASDELEPLPERGRPRTISLDEDPATTAPGLDALEQLELAMRRARPIDPVACDDEGFADPLAVPELIWGGDPVPGREFRPLEELADGGQMGFAIMENRSSYVRPARAGDLVQSFGAQLAVLNKAMVTRHWLFDVDRRDLIAMFTVVNVAFDTTARRAIRIPDEIRRRWSSRLHPELGPPLDS